MSSHPPPVVDVICVGFGPAAVACAIAFVEKRQKIVSQGKTPALNTIRFVERQPRCSFHPGMLLPGTSMQITFLKDLATLRSPTSSYTFINYLHEHNRLVTYINRGSFIPSRREFSDYLFWAANKVTLEDGIDVLYDEEVLQITSDGTTVAVHTHRAPIASTTRLGHPQPTHTHYGRHLVIAPGGVSRIPPSLAPIARCPQIIHTSVYARSIDQIISSISVRFRAPNFSQGANIRPLRIAVVGSGQSAAEVLLNLHGRLAYIPFHHDNHGEVSLDASTRAHSIDLIIRKGSLKPSDDSPFTNEIFDPSSTDFVYDLPSSRERAEVKREYENTNYGVVNPTTIQKIYETIYEQRVEDDAHARDAPSDSCHRPRINILPYFSIVSAISNGCDHIPQTFSSEDSLSCEDATVVEAEHRAPVPHTFTTTLRHILGAALDEERTYDAIIMGTGYERQSWLHMLDEDSFGNVFGFSNHPSSSSSGFAKANHIDRRDSGKIDAEDPQEIYAPLSPPTTTAAASSRSRSSSRDDAAQTPDSRSSLNMSPVGGSQPLEERLPSGSRSTTSLTSSHHPVGPEDETEMLSPAPSGVITRVQGLKISRAYRLLPRDPWGENGASETPLKAFKPRVYIQGIAEETHGMSDTLLSVVSVRAGEVMDDLFRSEEARVREEDRAM
ncbi:hypothetical protein BS47DRAFT_1482875 [Hydnum rufescens UP504]|uniref:L-ornithine N(5)-monooxygenase [NAD(P)H] n=1 Tax=Hydnum rufescens UP504 TaxID=1448309 RepID=A0A9P6B5J9_9AGAM|nr:hypothetical protein BS47DRAFT_1482875 [Hydnum rufescens UP504]